MLMLRDLRIIVIEEVLEPRDGLCPLLYSSHVAMQAGVL